MKRAVPVLAVTLGAWGCVYLNALYNADRLFGEAERARLAGVDSVAAVRYDSVVAKAARSFAQDPDGPWADDALYLLGRAWLRMGDLPRAREALTRALARADDPDVRRGATLYLGAVASLAGERERAIALLNEALRELDRSPLLGEGHLWRARTNLASGRVDAGWWDLDRAREADPRLTSAADLERVVWGIAGDDRVRAGRGVARLLAGGPPDLPTDTLVRLVALANGRWGPGPAAELLAEVEASSWPPDDRNRLLLLRARLRLEAGDTTSAREDAERVADGFGAGAVEARLFLGALHLGGVATVQALDGVRPLLLPVSDAPGALEVLDAVRRVELLDEKARMGRPIAWFAAGELARDALHAPALARAFFLAYADGAGTAPWAGKALLAALALVPDDGSGGPAAADDRARIEDGLARLDANPYVRAARTGWFPSAEFERLEATLRSELGRVLDEVTAEADQLDVLLRARADTLVPGGGTSSP